MSRRDLSSWVGLAGAALALALAATGSAPLVGRAAAQSDELRDAAPWEVSIIEPERHEVLAGPVRVLARIDDPQGLVVRAELLVGGNKLSEQRFAPRRGSMPPPRLAPAGPGVGPGGPHPPPPARRGLEPLMVEFEFDAGDSPQRRTISVVAYDRGGRAAGSAVTTRGVKINMAVRVDLIPLHVTVLDAQAHATLQLGRGDFEIYDRRKRQELRHFDKGEMPVTVALLLDTSMSMMGSKLVQAQTAVRSLLASLRPEEQVVVLPFSDRIAGVPQFTADKQSILTSLAALEARGGTSLNDAIYAGLTLLQQVEGKKALLVFSDGEEIHSALDGEAVLWAAKNSPALIYLVGLRGKEEEQRSYTSSWRNAARNQQQERDIAESVAISGGRMFRLKDIADLEGAFAEIAQELRSQYYLGYYPSDLKSRGEFRAIEVKVNGPYKVRTRRGYYDSASWLTHGGG